MFLALPVPEQELKGPSLVPDPSWIAIMGAVANANASRSFSFCRRSLLVVTRTFAQREGGRERATGMLVRANPLSPDVTTPETNTATLTAKEERKKDRHSGP